MLPDCFVLENHGKAPVLNGIQDRLEPSKAQLYEYSRHARTHSMFHLADAII